MENLEFYEVSDFAIDEKTQDKNVVIENLKKCGAILIELHEKQEIEKELKEQLDKLEEEKKQLSDATGSKNDMLEASPQIESRIKIIKIIAAVLGLPFYIIGAAVTYYIAHILTNKYIRQPYIEQHREEAEAEFDEKYRKPLAALQKQYNEENNTHKKIKSYISSLRNSTEYDIAKKYVGNTVFNLHDLKKLLELLESNRADSLKEALNLLDEIKHRERMEKKQEEILEVNKQISSETTKLKLTQYYAAFRMVKRKKLF